MHNLVAEDTVVLYNVFDAVFGDGSFSKVVLFAVNGQVVKAVEITVLSLNLGQYETKVLCRGKFVLWQAFFIVSMASYDSFARFQQIFAAEFLYIWGTVSLLYYMTQARLIIIVLGVLSHGRLTVLSNTEKLAWYLQVIRFDHIIRLYAWTLKALKFARDLTLCNVDGVLSACSFEDVLMGCTRYYLTAQMWRLIDIWPVIRLG